MSSDDASLLVDLSGNPIQNLLHSGIDPLTFKAVVMTHAHADHLYDLPSLIQTLRLLKRDKQVLMLSNPPTAGKAEELLSLFNLLDEAGHSTGAQVGESVERAGVGTLFLCHFDRSGDSMDSTDCTPEQMKSEAQKSFSGKVVIPQAFLRYRI